jgi:ABC-type antimicrobial peptide transport system permease subunit
MSFVTRTTNNPAAASDAIRRIIGRRSPDVPVKSATLETLLADNLARPRFRAFVLGAMAGLAVLLAIAGVYGVMAYGVGLRSAEFSVRMAIGAEPRDVIRMVLAQGAAVALGGLALGIAGALAAARVLESMLWGVSPRDPATYTAVTVLVFVVAVAANLGPALRAGRVNPTATLR